MSLSIRALEVQANVIRQDVIRTLAKAGSGHTAGPLGIAMVYFPDNDSYRELELGAAPSTSIKRIHGT